MYTEIVCFPSFGVKKFEMFVMYLNIIIIEFTV